MPEEMNRPNKREAAEERIDEQTAALEESDEQSEASSVVEEANASLGETAPMQEFDLYINSQAPNIGLYVPHGKALPGFADSKQWVFYRSQAGAELSTDLVQKINTDGHAFQELG